MRFPAQPPLGALHIQGRVTPPRRDRGCYTLLVYVMSLCNVHGYGPPPPSCIGYLEDSSTWDTTYNPHGRFANLLLDDWFKRAFGSKDSKRLLELLLQELIPERKIHPEITNHVLYR